jgi:hypothetical protein
MLFSCTLSTSEDTGNDASIAIRTIAGLFGLLVTISTAGPGETPPGPGEDLSAATVGFGGVAAAHTLPPADAETAALLSRVEVDADLLPWDNRIHAASKAKNQDGRWKAKPKIDPAERLRVESELRVIMGTAAPPAAAAVIPPPPAAAAVIPPPPAAAAVIPPPPAAAAVIPPPPAAAAVIPPPPAAAAVIPPPPAATTPATPATFASLMEWLGPYMASQQLTPALVSEAMRTVGVVDATGNGSVQLLAMRPDLIGNAYAELCNRIPR